MFEYVFMQRGILVGILLGAIIPLVGVTVVPLLQVLQAV